MTPTSNRDTGIGSSLPQNTLCERSSNGTLIDPRLLRTGYVPSQLEVQQLKEAIKEEEHQLEGSQEQQYLCLSERIQQRRSIVSAVRRVPFELWRDIFSLLCKEPDGYSFETIFIFTYFDRGAWPSTGAVMSVPNILSNVCSLWREIVSNSPSLWSSFHIGLDARFDPQIRIPFATHLHNSKDFPFTLLMWPYNHILGLDDIVREKTRDIFRVVLPHLWRCRVLDLRWSSVPGLLEDIMSSEDLPPFSFTHLTELRLDLELPGLDPYEPFWKAVSEAPMLRSLYTYSIPDPGLFPCHQLTELQVRSVYEAYVMSGVLADCESLQSLRFDNFIPPRAYWHVDFATTDITDPPLVLPCLQHLRVNMSTFPNDVFPFFIDLVFPKLIKLELSCYSEYFARRTQYLPVLEWPPSFLRCFERSVPEITHLKLDLNKLQLSHRDVLDIAPILRATPKLTHLELTLSMYRHTKCYSKVGHLTDFFLNHFGITSADSTVLLTRLSHLYVYDDSQRLWDLDLVKSVLGVLESRSFRSLSTLGVPGVSPLSVFHMVYCDWYGPSETDRKCSSLDKVPGSLGLIREFEVEHGMRCRIAHATYGVRDLGKDYVQRCDDNFDPRFWMRLDEQLEMERRDHDWFDSDEEDGDGDWGNESQDGDEGSE